jgi:hypothetical protein
MRTWKTALMAAALFAAGATQGVEKIQKAHEIPAEDLEAFIPGARGAFDSDRLIEFEDSLDYLEANFAKSLACGGDPDYETKLAAFERQASELPNLKSLPCSNKN